jgi:hypothetical protein
VNIRILEAARQLGIRSDVFKNLERKGIISIRKDRRGHLVFSEEELKEVETVLFDGYYTGHH